MTPERWSRIKSLLLDALDKAPGERAAFLDKECAADADLRLEVDSLLAQESDIDEKPVGSDQRLGPYRVLREIGRGGMGVVYLAERDDQLFEKQVAIKLLETSLRPQVLVRRFESERRILARLEHPAIARLIDAGVAPGGKPYFVLEYVEGVTLSELLRQRKLKLRECLDLFLEICAAVSYAHHQLVVHLDLKPGNVMVKPDGSPKLLDFGLAKMLDPITGDGGDPTVMHLRILTPAYASPEQKSGEALTVASDVYSLGKMLRTMLNEPEGDLVNILDLATREEPGDRYQSVEQFAEDIERYLKGLPVAAREDTLMYRAGKFIRRRKLPLAAAFVSVASLIAGLSVALWEAHRADRRFNEVRQLANSFLFEFHDAVKDLPGATPVRELILNRAQQYLDSLAAESGNDAGLKHELATSYMKVGEAQGLYYESNLGKKTEAQASFRKALDLFEALAKANPRNAEAQAEAGTATLRFASTLDDAKALEMDQDVARRMEALVKANASNKKVRFVMGSSYFGIGEKLIGLRRFPDALAHFEKARGVLEGLVKDFPDDHEWAGWLARSSKRLAAAYFNIPGKMEKATAYLSQAREIDEKALARDPNNATAKMDLALDVAYAAAFANRAKNYEKAVPFFERAIALRAEVAAIDPRNFRVRSQLARDHINLAGSYRMLKKLPDAKQEIGKAREIIATLGESDSAKGAATLADAEMRKIQGQPAQPR